MATGATEKPIDEQTQPDTKRNTEAVELG